MRDKQLATFLETYSGFRRGLISSDKPNDQQNLCEILESATSEKYFLSPTACAGILRRAEKRGKELPPALRQALQQVVAASSELERVVDKIQSSLSPQP